MNEKVFILPPHIARKYVQDVAPEKIGFKVSEDMMPHVHKVLTFSKAESDIILNVYDHFFNRWRYFPPSFIEQVLYRKKRMF